MKVQAKQLLIALSVIAVMVLAAVLGLRWLDRPREFSSLLPFSLSEVTYCSVYLEYGSPGSTSVNLSPEQTRQLLDLLSQSYYRRVGPAEGLSDEESPLLRINLHTSGSHHLELMLNGEAVLVNPLTHPGRSLSYRTEDSRAQHETLLTSFLEGCLTQSEA